MKKKRKLMTRRARWSAIALVMTMLLVQTSARLQAQTSSAPTSRPSATPVDKDEALRRACAEAVEELAAARKLLHSQGLLIGKQDELLKIEREIREAMKDLRNLDARQKEELLKALAAKDRVIAALESEVAVYKKKRFTLWKGAKIVVVAFAAGYVAAKLFK